MRYLTSCFLICGVVASTAIAQPPPGREGGDRSARPAGDVNSFLNRLMAYDGNQDGRLSKDELKDARLHALFDRADADKDGVATKEELSALFTRESATLGPVGRGGPSEGPGGRGGPGAGPGGPGGSPGGPGGGPGGRPGGPGQLLPPFLQEVLGLSDEQRKQVADLQQEVDAKLAKILTESQRQQLREMRERGPGGVRPGPEGRPPGGAPDRRPQLR